MIRKQKQDSIARKYNINENSIKRFPLWGPIEGNIQQQKPDDGSFIMRIKIKRNNKKKKHFVFGEQRKKKWQQFYKMYKKIEIQLRNV